MEGEWSDGGTDGGEESGGAGLSFCPWAAVFVGKRLVAFMGGRSHWQAVVFVRGQGVMSWELVIHTGVSSLSTLSFVVAVAVLGAGLLFMGATSLFVGGGACLKVVYIMVCCVVATLHHSYGCHIALLAMWPLYPCVRRGWRTKVGTYLNEHTVTMWHICHIISAIHMAVLVHDLGVVVCVCCEGCAQSIILVVVVVAVGESSEVAGPVGIDDGGGGWNGTIV